MRLLRSGKECPSTHTNGNQAARSSAQLNHAPENRVEPNEENPREGYTRWEELTSGCLENRSPGTFPSTMGDRTKSYRPCQTFWSVFFDHRKNRQIVRGFSVFRPPTTRATDDLTSSDGLFIVYAPESGRFRMPSATEPRDLGAMKKGLALRRPDAWASPCKKA